jgi:TolB-like protein
LSSRLRRRDFHLSCCLLLTCRAIPTKNISPKESPDDLTTDLSRIPGSFVIARNTAFTYKGKSVDVKQIGQELGVRYVIEGSVRRSGNQVQVNVQLIDAESGAHLWADRFDTDGAKLADTQNEITGRLARTLNIALLQTAHRRIEREGTADADARDLVMRGWARFDRGDPNQRKVSCFSSARWRWMHDPFPPELVSRGS